MSPRSTTGRSVDGADDRAAPVPPAVRSARGKLVYGALAARGEATVEELQAATGVSKLMLYGVLGALADRGVVTAEGGLYRIPKG